mgnify:CR=1 FL=1
MVQSLERQLTTLRACYDRIEAYEASHGVHFEWVLRTRTDTAFLAPVRPHCRAPADAVTKLELLAELRTHGAADVKTVGRALVDPVAAALDADAERCADADPVSAAVRHPDAGPDVQ